MATNVIRRSRFSHLVCQDSFQVPSDFMTLKKLSELDRSHEIINKSDKCITQCKLQSVSSLSLLFSNVKNSNHKKTKNKKNTFSSAGHNIDVDSNEVMSEHFYLTHVNSVSVYLMKKNSFKN